MIRTKIWSLWVMIKSTNDTSFNSNEEKIVINRDVKFDQEGEYDFKVDDGEKYDFLLVLDEENERYKNHQNLVTPSQLSINSTSPLSYTSSESSSSGNSSSPPKKIMSLDDLYKVTNSIDDDLKLYYHIATCEPIVFEKKK